VNALIGGKWRWVALGAGLLSYAVLSHISNSVAQAKSLGVILAVAPALLGCVLLGWRTRYRVAALAASGLIGLLVIAIWPLLQRHFAWLFLLQQCSFFGVLAAVFGRSLAAPHTPLCTQWADMLHGPLTPELQRYTRQVTTAWTLFFVCLVAVLLLLFWLAPLKIWSAFDNFCTLPLVALMFLAEYRVRRRRLPQLPPISLSSTVSVYLQWSRNRAAAPGG
jgi:uncharacterized membrane protein